VRSGNSAHVPRNYTVEPHKHLSDGWSVAAVGASDYDLSVYGPNGFLRAFKGSISGFHGAKLDVRALYDEERNGIQLSIGNQGSRSVRVSVYDKYTGRSIKESLEPGESVWKRWSLARSCGWYDLFLTVDEDSRFKRHFAGHVETGKDSISDPAMGRARLND
jgi:phospholipase C